MTDKLKNEDGFSLLEIIISIGIMSVLSIFILQMFMTVTGVNLRARNMDTASHIAAGVLVDLSLASNPNELLDSDFIIYTRVAFGLSAFFVMEERQAFASFDFSSGFMLYKYYDENWQVIRADIDSEEGELSENEDIAFILRLYMTPYTASEGSRSDMDLYGLFSVEIDVRDLNRSGSMERILAEFYTKIYFAETGELYGI